MSRLLTTHTSKKKVKHIFCLRCLNSFTSQETLAKHMEYCSANEAVKIEMPEEGTTLSFNNYNRSMRVPFIVYADFQSFIKPIDTCGGNTKNSYTKQYQKHTPSSFCYYINCFDDEVYSQNPVTYTAGTENEDVAQIFVNMLDEDVKSIYKRFDKPKKVILERRREKSLTGRPSAGFAMASLVGIGLETTVTSLENTEEQHIIYVISNIGSQNSSQ